MSPRPLGYATLAVLKALAEGHRYGFDVIDHTGLPSGTVYPALSALSRRGLVRSDWEEVALAQSDGRPRRRYYQVTQEGRAVLRESLERLDALGLAGRHDTAPEGAR
jgi:DNA-binding PadR family transcriptional regulator